MPKPGLTLLETVLSSSLASRHLPKETPDSGLQLIGQFKVTHRRVTVNKHHI